MYCGCMGPYGRVWGPIGSQPHRIAQVGSELKGHWVQLQSDCSALTMGSCGVVGGPVGLHRMCGALWGCRGSLWGCKGPCWAVRGPVGMWGALWGCMGTYEVVWDPLGMYGALWACMGSYRIAAP